MILLCNNKILFHSYHLKYNYKFNISTFLEINGRYYMRQKKPSLNTLKTVELTFINFNTYILNMEDRFLLDLI